jgi:hypothetical protein
MKHWSAALFILLCACNSTGWSDLDNDNKIAEDRWYKNGVVIYVTPKGMAQFQAQSSALLTAAFGAGISFAIGQQSYLDQGKQHLLGGETVLLRPHSLEIIPIEESNHISMRIVFQPLAIAISLESSHPGCKASVAFEQIESLIELEAARSLLGNINFLAVENGVSLTLSSPMISVGSNCSPMSAQTQDAALLLCQTLVTDALETVLTGRKAFVGEVARMAEALLGLDATGRMDIKVSDPTGQPGQFSVALTAHDQDSSAVATLVSNGIVTVPLQLGIASQRAGCAEQDGIGEMPSPVATQAPIPDLKQFPADVVVALGKQALNDVWAAATHSGLLCGGLTNPNEAMLNNEVILPLIEPALKSAVDKDSQLLLRLQPTGPPTLVFDDDQQSLNMHWNGIHLEIYAQIWNTRWLVFEVHDLQVEVTHLTPELTPGGKLQLNGGSWSTSASKDATAVVKAALLAASKNMTLFALPQLTPYPLENARFELRNEHLIMYADLATQVAPILGTLHSAVSAEPSPAPTGNAEGCSYGGYKSQPLGMLLLLIAALILWFIQRSRLAWLLRRKYDL